MNLCNVKTTYRSASDLTKPIEDGSFFNPFAKCIGLSDGNSAAYCNKHPPLLYKGGLTGGQMATKALLVSGIRAFYGEAVETTVLTANGLVFEKHRDIIHGYHSGKDVGGASFAVCNLISKSLDCIIAGDAFLAIFDEEKRFFYHGFDEAASRVEEQDNMGGYASCLEKTKTDENPEGDQDEAWNLYYLQYRAKREKYANRLIGQGGYASLNGDVALSDCWLQWKQEVSKGTKVVLGTDGFLWSGFGLDNVGEFYEAYELGGANALLALRDQKDYLPHIGRGKHPEGTLIEFEVQ